MAQEKRFETKIKKFLDEQGCWCVKFFANAYTKKGIPDLLCCVNGFFLAIEVKAENGRASELQKWNIDKIRSCGGKAIILKPSQFESFKELVNVLKNEVRVDVNYKLNPTTFRNLYGLSEV